MLFIIHTIIVIIIIINFHFLQLEQEKERNKQMPIIPQTRSMVYPNK